MIPNEVFYFATQGNKRIPSITCSSHTGTSPCEVRLTEGQSQKLLPFSPHVAQSPMNKGRKARDQLAKHLPYYSLFSSSTHLSLCLCFKKTRGCSSSGKGSSTGLVGKLLPSWNALYIGISEEKGSRGVVFLKFLKNFCEISYQLKPLFLPIEASFLTE